MRQYAAPNGQSLSAGLTRDWFSRTQLGVVMSSRSRHSSPRRQITRLFRRHRPLVLTLFAATVAVLGALLIFSRLHPG